jgi:hypothetical protein
VAALAADLGVIRTEQGRVRRPDTVRLATLAVGIVWFAVAGCAARNVTVDAPTVQIIPDVSDEEWASAVVFDKALMKSPRMLHGSHRPSAASIAKGQYGIAKVATVIRKDGTVGFYRVLETNNPGFANAVAALLKEQRWEVPILNGVPVVLRVESVYRVSRDED